MQHYAHEPLELLGLSQLIFDPKDTMKNPLLLVALTLLFAITLPLHAQTGCADSPENPTVILAIVGSAGAFFVSARARIKAHRK